MALGGTAMAVLSAAWTLGSGPLLVWSAPMYFLGFLGLTTAVGAAGLAVTRVRPRVLLPEWWSTRAGLRWWRLLCLGFAPATLATWLLAVMGPDWLLTVGWHVPGSVYAAVALWAGWWWPRDDRWAAAHADRYLHPDDLGEHGRELIVEIQRTVDTVEEADRRMGDSFDGRQPLSVLRAEEWRIASMLHQHERIREEHGADSLEAASQHVRDMLNRQHTQQETSYRVLAARVDRIRDYGAAVNEALRAHTEWERVHRAEERQHQLDSLLVQAGSDGGNADQLRAEVLNARAAKEARDELIDQALKSERLLTTSDPA